MRPIIRRRMAGGDELPADVIMTTNTNPKVLAICHAQGWCGSKYMTATEAAAVTDIGTAFSTNTSITSFEELRFFTSVQTIPSSAFYNCTKLTKVILPPNITSVESNAFKNSLIGNVDLVFPDSLTAIGSGAFYGTKIGKYLILPNNITSIGAEAFRKSSFRLLYVPQSCTTFAERSFAETPNGLPKIAVINRNTRPGPASGASYLFQTGTPKWKLYVPVGATGNYAIRDGGVWLYKIYIQSVSEIPSTFDTSSREAIIASLDALDAIVGGVLTPCKPISYALRVERRAA